MPKTIPARPFDDIEALAWLRSQRDGRVTASAAELGRQWGWNGMRTGRRLKAWQDAGHIRRNAEAIIVTASATPTVTKELDGTVLPAERINQCCKASESSCQGAVHTGPVPEVGL